MIGMHATTGIKIKLRDDGKYEARQGFGLFGTQNMTDEDIQKTGRDPFHPEFYDNYHSGVGDTEEQAIEEMKIGIHETSESMWL